MADISKIILPSGDEYNLKDAVFRTSTAASITSTDINNWNNKSTFSGSYNDLTNKPSIPSATTVTQTLTSGIEIATINGVKIYAPSYPNASGVSF